MRTPDTNALRFAEEVSKLKTARGRVYGESIIYSSPFLHAFPKHLLSDAAGEIYWAA